MIIYIMVFVASLLVAARIDRTVQFNNMLSRNIANRICLMIIFIILFSVSALRYYTGNDYGMYINKFHDAYYDYYVVTEPGFNILVKAIYSFLVKENYVLVFAIFAFLTVGFFLKAIYDQSEDFALSYFFFMAFGIFFQSLNTVRNYLALAIALYSIKYVIDRKYVQFLIWIIIASLFHKTALIVIPLYILASIDYKRYQVAIICVLSLSGLIFPKQLLEICVKLYPSYAEEEAYLAGTGISIVNIFRCAAVLIAALPLFKKCIKGSRTMSFYFYCNLFAMIIYCCFSFVPFLSRIAYYLNITHIFFIPRLIRSIEKDRTRKLIRLLAIIAGIIYFAAFLYKASDEYIKILPYNTWLNDSELVFIPVNRMW